MNCALEFYAYGEKDWIDQNIERKGYHTLQLFENKLTFSILKTQISVCIAVTCAQKTAQHQMVYTQ